MKLGTCYYDTKLIVDCNLFKDEFDYNADYIIFNSNIPLQLLKICFREILTNEDLILKFNKSWLNFNLIPNTAKIEYIGYLEYIGDGDKNRLLPVYTQKKMSYYPSTNSNEWLYVHRPKILKILKDNGYNIIDYKIFNDKYELKDIQPLNMGYDELGELYFIDMEINEITNFA